MSKWIDLTIDQHIKRLMERTGITEEHARRVVEAAVSDPEKFKINQQLIEAMRQKEANPKPTGMSIKKIKASVGRNDPCPCGCGKKFKNCPTFREPRIYGAIFHRSKKADKK